MSSAALQPADRPASGWRRGRSFAVSVAAAFGLNLVALGVFAAVTARWQAPLGGSTRPTIWITAVQVAHTPPQPEPQEAPTPARIASPPIAAVEEAPPQRPTAVTTHSPPVASDHGSAVRFYRSGEVDRPAEPEGDSDWNLDTAILDTAGIDRLVFEIFVGRTGEVVGCAILEPAALDAAARQVLEDRLRETMLRPAVRGGVAVASVRRIEVSVLPPVQ